MQFLYRFSPAAIKTPRLPKPISSCTIFANFYGSNAYACGTSRDLIRESKDEVFKREMLTIVGFKERLFPRFPAAAHIMVNSLMFAIAPEALAETCAAKNFFFNMPLLLFVAFVGATIGGSDDYEWLWLTAWLTTTGLA